MKVDRRGLLQAMSVGAALAPVLSLNSAFASDSDSSGQEASPAAKFVQMDPNVSFDKQIVNNGFPMVSISVGPRKLQSLGVSSYLGFSVKPSPARIMRTKTVPVTYPRPQTGSNSADGAAARISATEEPAAIRR